MKKSILTIVFAALTMGAAAQSQDSTCVGAAGTPQASTDCAATCQSQDKNYTAPQFPGGQEALMKFLSKNVRYPQAAEAYGVEGIVVMQFFVNVDGKVSDISAHDCKIERFNTTKFSQQTEARQKELKLQFAKLFAKEGARVIRKMPKWQPGKLNDKVERVKLKLPIRFSIPDK